MKTALIAGSTGLIGKELLKILLASPRYSQVIALTRKDLAINDPKLKQIITDLPTLKEKVSGVKADDVFCCLGTTMKKAGSKEKFYEVDFTYPHELAKIMKANGARQFQLVSALGANKGSRVYYNRVKADVENAISKLGFPILHIIRPSLLFGGRQESRPGEMTAKILFGLFGFLIPAKYKGIEGKQVAHAMMHYSTVDEQGIFIHESDELRKIR